MQCISVDLPEPDGPITAVNFACSKVDGHPVEGVDPWPRRCRRS